MGLIPFFIYLTRKYLFHLYFIQCFSLDCYYLRITKTSFRFASKFLSKIIVFNNDLNRMEVYYRVFTKLRNIVEMTQKTEIFAWKKLQNVDSVVYCTVLLFSNNQVCFGSSEIYTFRISIKVIQVLICINAFSNCII